MKKSFIICIALSLILGAGALCHGQVIIQHSGPNDPSAEGFSLVTPGEAETGPVFDDQGLNSWSIRDTAASGSTFYQYELSPTEESKAATFGWTLSGSFRFVEAGIARLSFRTGNSAITLGFRLDEEGDIWIDQHQTVIHTLSGAGTEYHEYVLAYDSIEEVASMWIDGSDHVEDIQWLGSSMPSGVLFGNWGRSAHTRWHDATFETIPEPETVALLAGMGALLIAGGIRWRDRKKPHQ